MNNPHGPCLICGLSSSLVFYPAILKCSHCGYIYADLNLSQKDFEALYQNKYFHGDEYSNYLADEIIIKKNFKSRLKVLQDKVENSHDKSLLEVGCAYGFFLQVARPFYQSVMGIDVTKEGVDYINHQLGLTAIKMDLEHWDFQNKNYDVVCLWDTIEHLRDPDIYIKKIASHLNPKGLIALTTGDIGSLVARVRKSKWRLIHPPTHAHYFNKNTLKLLLQKHGLEIIHFEHSGAYRSLDLICYQLFVIRWKFSWIYRLLKKTKILSFDIYLNFFDIMYVIARVK
ncbi:MAG: class I SAM-dependent methyltransferase [Bacteriovoracaceae bacterium]|nr:class I SAM-dependent methyltransferase [Bacteriovoracaceae bacterium]